LKEKIKQLEEENKKIKELEQQSKAALAQSRDLSTQLVFENTVENQKELII
jgi:hypothetical protein